MKPFDYDVDICVNMQWFEVQFRSVIAKYLNGEDRIMCIFDLMELIKQAEGRM